MATTVDYIEFICDEIRDLGFIRYKKMFGEYMVYINDKPVLTVCDNTIYVKKLDVLAELMKSAEGGFPYKGAKEHYILDIEDQELSKEVLRILVEVIPVPKPKTKGKHEIEAFVNECDLLLNLDQLHTTKMGQERIKKNLILDVDDVVDWCRKKIQIPNASITKQGKNWYITVDNCIITVNASSFTLITAHKTK